MNQDEKQWALVTTLRDDVNASTSQDALPQIQSVCDEWQMQGKFLWSGPFDDNKTSLTIITATKQDAQKFLDKYIQASNAVLNSYMYQWDSLPMLGLFEKPIIITQSGGSGPHTH